jgi:hypothetical protein
MNLSSVRQKHFSTHLRLPTGGNWPPTLLENLQIANRHQHKLRPFVYFHSYGLIQTACHLATLGPPSAPLPYKIRYSISSLKLRVFWDVAPCSHAEVDRRFRGAHCLCHLSDESSSIHYRSEHGGSTHLWNVSPIGRDYMVLHPRRL